ncbi:MAG: hypothetical protein ABI056_05220 [Caulobacteraceae bacterium]
MRRTFVGLHISKCAGSSFLEMALAALPRYQIYQNTSIIRNWSEEQPEFLDISTPSRLRLVWGHSVHEQMLHRLSNPILFTGLRDPVERLASDARYQVDLAERQRRGPFPLEAWLARQRNPMCWFIINRFPALAHRADSNRSPFDKARSALECFHHVYFNETFDESVGEIFSALGVSPDTKHANIGKRSEAPARIDRASLKYDLELYEWARPRFAGVKIDVSAPPADRLAAFLKKPADIDSLAKFLFRSQAGEYAGWGKLDQVIDRKLDRALLMMREISTYRAKL